MVDESQRITEFALFPVALVSPNGTPSYEHCQDGIDLPLSLSNDPRICTLDP